MKRMLKIICFLLIVLSATAAFAQAAPVENGSKPAKAKFAIVFDKTKETKDGYYLNGYLVNISRAKGETLDGKKIEIEGRVTIIKGIGSGVDENGVARQGRQHDIQYIKKPKIRILQ